MQNLEFPLKSFTYGQIRMMQCFFTDECIFLYILNNNTKHKSTCFIALIQQTNTLNVSFLKEYEILPKAWLLFDYHSFP